MKDGNIKEKCEILEKVIIATADAYSQKGVTPNQKALLETMIGAAIFYISNSESLYTGFTSEKAIEAVRNGFPVGQLTKEHAYPRKIAGKFLLTTGYKNFFDGNNNGLYDLFMNELGRYNCVTKKENEALKPFQKDDTFTDIETSYRKAGITLKKISKEELRNTSPEFHGRQARGKLRSGNKKTNENKLIGKDNQPVKSRKTLIDASQESEMEHNAMEEISSTRNIKAVATIKDISGIRIDGSDIDVTGKANTSNCFRAFMEHCIANHHQQIASNYKLRLRFKLDPEDPSFGRGIYYDRIEGLNGLYYTTYLDSKSKIRIMNEIAHELGFDLEFSV